MDLSLTQVELLGLIAPRPVLVTEGLFDFWASPDLSLRAVQESAAWYQKEEQERLTLVGQWLHTKSALKYVFSGPLAYGITQRGHAMHADYWPFMLDFLHAQGLLNDSF